MLTLINRALGIVFLPSASDSLLPQIAWTIFRVVCGFTMIHNGLDKFADIPGFSEAYVEVIGLPFPIFFAYVAAATETIGAPLVMIGLGTRLAALGLASTMFVAMYHHILVGGFSIPYLELSMVYAASFLFLAVIGAGQFSVDALIAKVITKNQVQSLEASLQAESSEPAVAETKATGWGSYLSR
ncbi:MAG: DoxX family protein [Cyanobacteria bacterium KgW148]|nr:DoxX family protein [Cyanobacteria bacterium KgW148]